MKALYTLRIISNNERDILVRTRISVHIFGALAVYC